MIVYLLVFVTDSDNNILNGNSPPIASQKAFNIIADSLRRIDVSTLSTGPFGSLNAFLFRFVWNSICICFGFFLRYFKYALSFQFSHALLLRTENNLWFFCFVDLRIKTMNDFKVCERNELFPTCSVVLLSLLSQPFLLRARYFIFFLPSFFCQYPPVLCYQPYYFLSQFVDISKKSNCS